MQTFGVYELLILRPPEIGDFNAELESALEQQDAGIGPKKKKKKNKKKTKKK